MAKGAIVDACTLGNFHVTGQMGLLMTRLAGVAHWTQTIQREAGRLLVSGTEWLGPALEVGGDTIDALLQVQLLREDRGAKPSDPATLHLGEAEAIYYIETSQPSWALITDDGPAADFARRRGLIAVETELVLADCYECGEIGCPAAFDLLCNMRATGRGVRVPPSHWDVCPPKVPTSQTGRS